MPRQLAKAPGSSHWEAEEWQASRSPAPAPHAVCLGRCAELAHVAPSSPPGRPGRSPSPRRQSRTMRSWECLQQQVCRAGGRSRARQRPAAAAAGTHRLSRWRVPGSRVPLICTLLPPAQTHVRSIVRHTLTSSPSPPEPTAVVGAAQLFQHKGAGQRHAHPDEQRAQEQDAEAQQHGCSGGRRKDTRRWALWDAGRAEQLGSRLQAWAAPEMLRKARGC